MNRVGRASRMIQYCSVFKSVETVENSLHDLLFYVSQEKVVTFGIFEIEYSFQKLLMVILKC